MKLQVKKGVLEMGVLARLARGDAHQYDIVDCLMRGIEMNEGNVYPLLRSFRLEGLVTTYLVELETDPPRKIYRLESRGREALILLKATRRAQFNQLDAVFAGVRE